MTLNPFRPPRPRNRVSIRTVLRHMPSDGCMLVFNAVHVSWRTKAHDEGLSTHVCDPQIPRNNGQGVKPQAKYRDLYITPGVWS